MTTGQKLLIIDRMLLVGKLLLAAAMVFAICYLESHK